MTEKNISGFKMLFFEKLKKEKKVFCGIFTKKYLNQNSASFSPSVLPSYSPFLNFLKENGADSYFSPIQMHTANVYPVEKNSPFKAEFFDAACTNLPGKALLSFSADCSISLFYDKKNKAIGTCHAGWKGALLNIYEQLYKTMKFKYGTKSQDLFVGIGPFISQKNYPVSRELYEKFKSFYGKKVLSFFKKEKGLLKLSIKEVLKFQLNSLGIKNCEFSDLCTYERTDILYSHRRKDQGRFALIAFLKK
ncbi:MAG: polyphenol oxidase family protein [Elusimicrobia bacterium]|nr:polyphenol oxidase family protein [Elusimicrobiota bacterium]